MPIYTMDLKIKLNDGSEAVLDGQYLLTIGFPGSDRWGFCSSDDAFQGLKGTFSYSEKLAFEGTTCFKENSESRGESATIVLRLRIFRGGVIDADSWREGKGGSGFFVVKPRSDIKNDFTWVIRKIDTSDDA